MNHTPQWHQEGKQHIWHPYTQMHTASDSLPVVGTEGVRIKLANGCELIDGISSWWSACHGYGHPTIREAMVKQLSEMPHVMFAGLAHEPAYTLAKRLVKITPPGLERVFFSDSGSTAVEIAMKMAVQYWRNIGQKNRLKFVSFRNGYHGDTMGAMSLCEPENSLHFPFSNYMPRQYVVDLPIDEYGFAEFEELLEDLKKTIAGVVIEPLVQMAGGMKFHSADMLAELYRLCKKHELLFIADEIATGFGRTGMMFACQEAGITPDILCLGKALTGGTCTLAATVTTKEVFDAFLSEDSEKAFMHGPTYMANPLACSAALASLDLFEKEPRLQQVAAIETQLWEELSPCQHMDGVVDVRVRGAVGVVQLQATPQEIISLRQRFIDKGLWLRPFADVIYLMPPFVINSEDLSRLTQGVREVVQSKSW